MRRLAAYTAIVVGTCAVLLLLWEVRLVWLAFMLSLFMAAFVRPLVRRLTRRGLSLVVAMILIYASGLGFIALTFFFLNATLSDEILTLSNDLAAAYEQLHPAWLEESGLRRMVAARLPPPEELFALLAAEEGRPLASTVLRLLQTIGTAVAGLILVLALSIYWSVDSEHFERLWLSLLRPERRVRARNVWRATETGVGRTMRSEMVQALLAILLLGLGYWLMGIRYPVLLALAAGLVWLVPIVGFLFTIPLAFFGGLATGLPLAVVSVVYTAAVLLLLGLYVEPRLFGRRRLYSPFLVVLLVVPLAEAWGILGFFVAPPLAVTIQSLLSNLLRHRRIESTAPLPVTGVHALREQLQQLRDRADETSDGSSQELESLMNRLQELLKVTEETLEEEAAVRPQQQ